ncbi:MAG TPA: methanogenesis marker 9 domain-containing protein, partial [Methanocorpusculum sp.]|nr:methanogenesis marker 9 domain-containing protein [Methanocorpusculum sp.]
CCMPVKQCPLIQTLKTIKISNQEYTTLKKGLSKGLPIELGSHTCFGSLIWCCKSSSPCMFRDMTLKSLSISKIEYMNFKHQLSNGIMEYLFDKCNTKQ